MFCTVVKRVFSCECRAVASLNTPLFPADPSVPPGTGLKAIPIFDYQIYFEKPVRDFTYFIHGSSL